MKIKSKEGEEYTVEIKKSGENKMTCPVCSHNRNKKNDKCLSFNDIKGFGRCNHCEMAFYKPDENFKKEEVRYTRPVMANFTELSDSWLSWFTNKRMISQTAINRMGVKTKMVWASSANKELNSAAFTYTRRGEFINTKYLGYHKVEGKTTRAMRLESNAELIWYNYDAILEYDEIIITEGEMDALSFISDGHYNVVSVPNGAGSTNLTYIDNSIKDLEGKTFIIAVDNDEAGRKLSRELVRRLGSENCKLADWGDFKDANEYYIHNQIKGLKNVLESAKRIRPEGVEFVEDIWEEFYDEYYNKTEKGVKIGLGLDNFLKCEAGRLMIITGVPGSGKSNFANFLNCKLNTMHGWKVGYWSSEMSNVNLLSSLSHILTGVEGQISKSSLSNMKSYLSDNFFFVDPNKITTIDEILAKFKYFVKAYGIKIINIDPFTNIDRDGTNDYNYIRETLNKLTRFAKENDVLVQLVAHPKKMQAADDGSIPMPSMYDISGSADFWNKCDYGIAVGRDFDATTGRYSTSGTVQIHKVKTTDLGHSGMWNYDYSYHRYFNLGRARDNDSWVETAPKQIPLGKEIQPFNPETDGTMEFDSGVTPF